MTSQTKALVQVWKDHADRCEVAATEHANRADASHPFDRDARNANRLIAAHLNKKAQVLRQCAVELVQAIIKDED